MIRIGIDTGGTFTDFVFFDGETILPLKLPSTPGNPALSILEGLTPYIDQDFELVHLKPIWADHELELEQAIIFVSCHQKGV